jgi:hypothetical protein
MLDNRTKALLRAVLYPVQFDRQPVVGIERVLKQVIGREALQATASEYMDAIALALESRDEKLSAIIPGTHSEGTVRFYLQQLSAALAREQARMADWAGSGTIATS